jgi:ankyrin repeat protein
MKLNKALTYFCFSLISSCSSQLDQKFINKFDLNNPIYKAINKNDKKAIDGLINQGFDINSEIFKCSYVVINVSVSGTYDFLKYVINKGADVNLRDCQGRTVLYYVDSSTKLEMLVQAGAKINIKDWINENTPLHEALKIGANKKRVNIDLVRKLVSLGADIQIFNKYGQKPLQYFKVRLKELKSKVSRYEQLSSPKIHQLELIRDYKILKEQEKILEAILL